MLDFSGCEKSVLVCEVQQIDHRDTRKKPKRSSKFLRGHENGDRFHLVWKNIQNHHSRIEDILLIAFEYVEKEKVFLRRAKRWWMGKVQEFMDENGKGFKNNEIRSQILRKVRLHTERNIVIRSKAAQRTRLIGTNLTLSETGYWRRILNKRANQYF